VFAHHWLQPFCATLDPSQLLCRIWATLHPSEKCCILPSFAASCWTNLHPFELCCIILSYYDPSGLWATLHHIPSKAELNCTLLNYVYTAPSKLRCTLTRSYLPSYNFFECRNIGLSGIQSVRYRNKKEMPMPELVRYRNAPLLRRWMPKCKCRRHRPRCRCPAMIDTKAKCHKKGLCGRCLSDRYPSNLRPSFVNSYPSNLLSRSNLPPSFCE
jgi:hypothetical protein